MFCWQYICDVKSLSGDGKTFLTHTKNNMIYLHTKDDEMHLFLFEIPSNMEEVYLDLRKIKGENLTISLFDRGGFSTYNERRYRGVVRTGTVLYISSSRCTAGIYTEIRTRLYRICGAVRSFFVLIENIFQGCGYKLFFSNGTITRMYLARV